MNSDYFRMIFDYNAWAHHRVWDCIIPLTDAQYTHDTGYAWRSVRGQLVHTMGAEWVWLSRLNGVSPDALPSEDVYPTRAMLRTQWDTVQAGLRAYLHAADDALLLTPLEYHTTKGVTQRTPRWQVLHHLANHGTDHRAQVLAMLHMMGAATIEQDFVFYTRERGL
ncbi:MAG: DinB family protein [bacterium]|nr:DinB family protein [bacterium]